MKLTASIVVWHVELGELRECLRSLRSPAVGRVTVVDNAAEPRVAEFLAAEFPEAEYLPGENVGYGAGHNRALRLALERDRSEYHLVLNSDVRFDPAVLDRLVEVMDARPEVGQLQPRIEYPDGRLQDTVRMLPTPLDVFGRRFLPERWMRRRNERYLLRHVDHSREFNPPYHQGSFMLLRTEALRRVGLFDERFFMYPEDIDLTRRIHEHYVTLYYPGERIVHDHRAGSYHNRRLLRIHCVNMLRYFAKWGFFLDPGRRAANAPFRH